MKRGDLKEGDDDARYAHKARTSTRLAVPAQATVVGVSRCKSDHNVIKQELQGFFRAPIGFALSQQLYLNVAENQSNLL